MILDKLLPSRLDQLWNMILHQIKQLFHQSYLTHSISADTITLQLIQKHLPMIGAILVEVILLLISPSIVPLIHLFMIVVHQFLFQKTKAVVSTYIDIIQLELIIQLGTLDYYTIDLQKSEIAKKTTLIPWKTNTSSTL